MKQLLIAKNDQNGEKYFLFYKIFRTKMSLRSQKKHGYTREWLSE